MSDRYLEFSHSGFGKALVSLLGLPQPPHLRRGTGPWEETPLTGKSVLIGASSNAALTHELLTALGAAGATLRIRPEHAGIDVLKAAAAREKITLAGNLVAGEAGDRATVVVFDASGVTSAPQLRELYDFFQPVVSQIPGGGRVIVVSRAPSSAAHPAAAACAAGMLGFVKSLGKELGRKGTTVNLIEVASGAEPTLAGALRFLASDHAAFISGQALTLTGATSAPPGRWAGTLAGKVALVTGAARGIGAAIADVLAREGAQIVGVDRPQEEGPLAETMARVKGAGLPIDITAADAAERIVQECTARFGGLDIVIHNAGITRDRMLRNMQAHYWDQVIEVNLAAILRINEKLLAGNGLKKGARIVCVSSIGGIAGNPGQTNYGATKAAIIGYCASLATEMGKRGGAINAVAPGFIETAMTASMPVMPRVMGRLMSSLVQGGLPTDIAEAVAFLASPHAAGVNGRTLRVCGQHLVGA